MPTNQDPRVSDAYEAWCKPRANRIEPDHPRDAFAAGYAAALSDAQVGGEAVAWGVFDAGGALLEPCRTERGARDWLRHDATRTVKPLGVIATPAAKAPAAEDEPKKFYTLPEVRFRCWRKDNPGASIEEAFEAGYQHCEKVAAASERLKAELGLTAPAAEGGGESPERDQCGHGIPVDPDKIDACNAALASLPPARDGDDLLALQRFAVSIIGDEAPGDIDGDDIQEIAVACGLLKTSEATQACGDDCACADEGADFPLTCYRLTNTYARALRADRAATRRTEGASDEQRVR